MPALDIGRFWGWLEFFLFSIFFFSLTFLTFVFFLCVAFFLKSGTPYR